MYWTQICGEKLIQDFTLQPLTLRIHAMKSTPTVASLPESKFSLVKDLLDTVS